MNVAYELKRKSADLAEQLQEISRKQAEIQSQLGALDRVIAVYDPDYVPANSAVPRRCGRPRKEGTVSPTDVDTLRSV